MSDLGHDVVSAVNNLISFIFSSAMIELDGDEIRISSRGRYAERDIVQVKVHVLFFETFLESKGHF